MTDHDHVARAVHHMTELSGVFEPATTGPVLRHAAALAADGSAHLLVESAGSQAAVQSLTIQEKPNAWNRLRTGIGGLVLTHTFGPSRLDAGATYELVVVLSLHPARAGRPAGQYSLRYRFAASPSAGRSVEGDGTVGVVRHPLPAPGTALSLVPADDAALLWPDVPATDNSACWLALVVTSPRAGAVADVSVQSVRFTWAEHDAAHVLAHLRAVRDANTATHPVRGYLSEEVGFGLPVFPHVNTFGVPPRYDDKAGVTATNFPAYYRQRVRDAHAQGGVVSWNHVFGFSAPPELPPAGQDRYRRQVFAAQAGEPFLGADLLEVGYASRGGMPFAQYLALWDTFSRRATFLTGNGVNDEHNGLPWRALGNGFSTGLWSAALDEAALVRALRAGRVFTAHAGAWPASSLDVLADGVVPMGGVTLGRRPSRQVAVSVAALPPDSVVELVASPVDGVGPDPAAVLVGSFTGTSLGPSRSGTVAITVDTSSGSCFVRAQVRRQGVLVATGNPLWFLDQAPAGGVPAARLVV